MCALAAASAAVLAAAVSAKTSAPVTAVWLDQALSHRHIYTRGGNDMGAPWMINCDGIDSSRAADNDTTYTDFRCFLSFRGANYMQEFRTYQAGPSTVSSIAVGRLFRLARTDFGYP